MGTALEKVHPLLGEALLQSRGSGATLLNPRGASGGPPVIGAPWILPTATASWPDAGRYHFRSNLQVFYQL